MTEDEYEVKVAVAQGTWPLGEEALKVADEAVRVFPGSARLWMLRGNAISFALSRSQCSEGYSLEDVLNSYRRATELDPHRAEFWEVLGRFYDATGNPAEAEKCSREVARPIKLRPKPRFALNEVVRICRQPSDRALLIGELGTLSGMEFDSCPLDLDPDYIPRDEGEYLYFLDIYRKPDFCFLKSRFWEHHLEPIGHHDGFHTDESPESAGYRAAALAIAKSQLYLCACGGLAVMTPELPQGKEEIFKDLPRRTLAAGCSDPMLERASQYARAFNGEIVKYLSRLVCSQ